MLKKGLSLLLAFALMMLIPGQTSAIIIGEDSAAISTSARIAELYELRDIVFGDVLPVTK